MGFCTYGRLLLVFKVVLKLDQPFSMLCCYCYIGPVDDGETYVLFPNILELWGWVGVGWVVGSSCCLVAQTTNMLLCV